MRELHAALAEARAGRGRLFLLTGESGIGKSRLLEETAVAAERIGVRVAWGRGWESGGTPPYWPWVQVLRSEAAGLNDGDLAARLSAHGARLSRLLPELGPRVGGITPAPESELPGARYAFFDAVVSFLAAGANATGLVVLLDDLYLADDVSLQLLQQMACDLPQSHLLVVATFLDAAVRNSAPLHRQLSTIIRLGRRMTLAGLDESGVAAMLEHETGSVPEASLVRQVHRGTDGNPLFVQEVGRLTATGGRLGVDGLVPGDAGTLIRRRLEPLSADVCAVLAGAAILGREFDLAALRHLSGLPAAALLDLMAAAVSSGVVEESTPGRWSFSHRLLREALRESLRPSQRAALHRQAGELIEAHRDRATSQLAHHFFEGARTGDAAKAATYCATAGDQAMRVLAFEQAAVLYGRALDALALTPPVDERRRYDLLCALGTATQRCGDLHLAGEAWRRAASAARAMGSGELLADAAIGYAATVGSSADELRRSLLEEARAALPPVDGRPQARVLVTLGNAGAQLGRELADQGLAMARRLGDPETLREVLPGWHLAARPFPELLGQRRQVAQEILDAAVEAGERERVVLARQWLAADLVAAGDVAGAAAHLEAGGREAGELGLPFLVWGITTQRANLALLKGQPGDADRLSRAALAIGERNRFADAEDVYREQFRALRMGTGRVEELEVETRRDLAQPSAPGWKAGCRRIDLALITAQLGRHDEAHSLFDGMAAPGGEPAAARACCLAGLTEVSWLLGDPTRAAALYDRFLVYAGRHVTWGVAGTSLGPGDRYLGQLAALAGRLDDAEARFDAAADLCRLMGAPSWLARTRADHARMLMMRGAPADMARAGQLADAACHGLAALGLTSFEKQTAALLAGPAASVPAPTPVLDRAALLQEGEYWVFAFAGDVARLRDSKGVRYLARLLRNPGRELHALDLVVGDSDASAGEAALPASDQLGAGGSENGILVDATARDAYRRRLADLQEELEEANAYHDPARADRAQQEIDDLVAVLTGALGLGGRDRKTASDAERARQSVSRAVKGTVERLGEAHPALGHHLRSTVRTGVFSSYVPDPRAPITWLDHV